MSFKLPLIENLNSPKILDRHFSPTKNNFDEKSESQKHYSNINIVDKNFKTSTIEMVTLLKIKEQDATIKKSLSNNNSDNNDFNNITYDINTITLLKNALAAAEKCLLEGDYRKYYNIHKKLSIYFQRNNDHILANHFTRNCTNCYENFLKDKNNLNPEELLSRGLHCIEKEDFRQAMSYFEDLYKLTLEMKTDSNEMKQYDQIYFDACKNLINVYIKLSKSTNSKFDDGLLLFQKSFQLANEVGNENILGEVNYQYGRFLVNNNQIDKSLEPLEKSFKIFERLNYTRGMCKTCFSMFKAHKKIGNVNESMEYLKRCITLPEKSSHKLTLARALTSYGLILFNSKLFGEALEHFNKAFKIVVNKRDEEEDDDDGGNYLSILEECRAYVAVTKVHLHMWKYNSMFEDVNKILKWKSNLNVNIDEDLIN